MPEDRGVVRVAREVFDELDRVLGSQRGDDGGPSVNDFLTIDLLPIIDVFAEQFDLLPPAVPGRSDYRLLVTAGVLVRAFAVIGQRRADRSIELIYIRLDLEPYWPEDDPA